MENTNCCKYNKMVDCAENKCYQCGWNPDVAAKRVIEWKKNNNYIDNENE